LRHANNLESNGAYKTFKEVLKLQGTEIIAINGKRGWWRRLPSKAFTSSKPEGDAGGNQVYDLSEVTEGAIENWVDQIRMGEGVKMRIPVGLIEVQQEDLAEAVREGGIKFGKDGEVKIEEVVKEKIKEEKVKEEPAKEKILYEGEGFKMEEIHDEL